MRRVTIITFIVAGLMIMSHVEVLSSEASDLPLLMDIAQLELKVTDTEEADRISRVGYPGTTLSAKVGYKLVVVSLEGTVQEPCGLPFNTTEFAAIYEKETTDYEGKKKLQVFVTESSGIESATWSIPPEGARTTVTFYIPEPGPITLRVVFILPEEITSFHVRYPALAQGKAAIPGKQDDNSRK